MESKLVSIVIPIYKVEKYLRKCVDSVLQQSYENLEIILVDDGSPDKCGEMCDEYEKKDKRIKVIHKENGGLSSARNVGLEFSRGEYIVFIDSDDWIDKKYIEKLYMDINENDAQIAVPAFCIAYDNGKMVHDSRIKKISVYTAEQALEIYLFNGYLTPCIASKMWKKAIWDNVRCPEGILFEDQYTTYKLLMMAEKIVFDPDVYYYYFKRNGSIGHSTFSDKTYDLLGGIDEEYRKITDRYPKLTISMKVARAVWEVVFINMMISSNKYDHKTIREIQIRTRMSIGYCLRCNYLPVIRKIELFLFCINFKLYTKIYIKYKKIKGIL